MPDPLVLYDVDDKVVVITSTGRISSMQSARNCSNS